MHGADLAVLTCLGTIGTAGGPVTLCFGSVHVPTASAGAEVIRRSRVRTPPTECSVQRTVPIRQHLLLNDERLFLTTCGRRIGDGLWNSRVPGHIQFRGRRVEPKGSPTQKGPVADTFPPFSALSLAGWNHSESDPPWTIERFPENVSNVDVLQSSSPAKRACQYDAWEL